MLKNLYLVLIVFIFSFLPVFAFNDDISVEQNDGIYTFKILLRKYQNRIRPYVSEELTTTADVFGTGKYTLVLNGGFFDLRNLPVSNVIIDEKTVQSLLSNSELIENLEKQGRAEKVLNRTEFRVLKNSKGDISFDINEHFMKPEENYKILHSIQAGPMLIPDFRIEEESFVKYENNKPVNLAADVLKRRERTIVGLKHNQILGDNLYIIIFTQNKKAALNEVRDYCKKLGLDKAMAFDGGASTSINYKDIEIYSSKDAQRKVKSFLVIEN